MADLQAGRNAEQALAGVQDPGLKEVKA